ncbi:hypothetical protein LOK49_LG01G02941 [Camellia lanceoleosa]|uniref:Uncharacterized protein n=1 Tax=Camellia lanceoleosa TaxID=1840588 RepID=A0ACC0IZH7_9ERIC|nr:hypothetical protein LOK49_LG01G02941 [Camellia lanceoleosa]
MAASSACLVGSGLSTHSTKPSLGKEIYGRRLFPSSSLLSLGKLLKRNYVTASLDQRHHEGRRGFLKLLLGNAGLSVPALLGGGNAYADDQGVSCSRMSYSRFLEYLDKDRVKKMKQSKISWRWWSFQEAREVHCIGAQIPKGVLLVGPPELKTLLAKAIAGEAGVPFFSISGSEFVEMFVGNAKKNAPYIVFVDEIDAVGWQRGTGIGGGNDEREQTLNQLLTEMDGFEGNTLRLMFDIRGRTEILKVHGSNRMFDADVSLEAAILAGRRGKTAISSKEIDDSIDRIVAGMEGTVMTDGKSKSLVAYHEVGHAICGTLTPGHNPVQKVTLIPRGQARGLTWFIPADDPTLISKQQLFARIVGGLGGRAADEVIFGEPEVTTGAAGDLQQITGLAKKVKSFN